MRTPPTSYNGLTLIIDKPSRFDVDNGRLLSGITGQWMEENCILPYKLNECEIRTADENTPIVPGTKRLILFGANTIDTFSSPKNIPHGYPLFSLQYALPTIGAFYPQDCMDHRQIESKGFLSDDGDDTILNESDTKNEYPTRRKNFRFWTQWYCQKYLHSPFIAPIKPDIRVYQPLDKVIKFLNATRNEDLYLDIETSRRNRGISCIGLSSNSIHPTVYTIPIYLYDNRIAYPDLHRFYRALALAFLNNQVVIHNAMFDLLILRAWYKLPYPRAVYDTMLANHRCVPEAEKSLSHVIAQWTWCGYHKNQITDPRNKQDDFQLWHYNGLDVYVLKLIKDAQHKYAECDSGLLASIAQVNSMIIPYLHTSLTGMRLDMGELLNQEAALKKRRYQFKRLVSILLGDSTFNPASSKQCAALLHRQLNYSVVKRSSTGEPSMGKNELYQLYLKYNNPLIPCIIHYRETAKELSMLASNLWKTP